MAGFRYVDSTSCHWTHQENPRKSDVAFFVLNRTERCILLTIMECYEKEINGDGGILNDVAKGILDALKKDWEHR